LVQAWSPNLTDTLCSGRPTLASPHLPLGSRTRF
jgi:hypothetical protein